jgi:hypothetical protein
MVASHDPAVIASAGEMARETQCSTDDFEYQMLYGIHGAERPANLTFSGRWRSGHGGYCRDIAILSLSSAVIRWSWLSWPMPSFTHSILPENLFPVGP